MFVDSLPAVFRREAAGRRSQLRNTPKSTASTWAGCAFHDRKITNSQPLPLPAAPSLKERSGEKAATTGQP